MEDLEKALGGHGGQIIGYSANGAPVYQSQRKKYNKDKDQRIGTTKSGKAVKMLFNDPTHSSFSTKDHADAARIHRNKRSKVKQAIDVHKKNGVKNLKPLRQLANAHAHAELYHSSLALSPYYAGNPTLKGEIRESWGYTSNGKEIIKTNDEELYKSNCEDWEEDDHTEAIETLNLIAERLVNRFQKSADENIIPTIKLIKNYVTFHADPDRFNTES